MSAYLKPDRCSWCCARLTSQNAAVVGDDLVCHDCADGYTMLGPADRERDTVGAGTTPRAVQQQRAAMKATARGLEA